jgi:hypothetical protein
VPRVSRAGASDYRVDVPRDSRVEASDYRVDVPRDSRAGLAASVMADWVTQSVQPAPTRKYGRVMAKTRSSVPVAVSEFVPGAISPDAIKSMGQSSARGLQPHDSNLDNIASAEDASLDWLPGGEPAPKRKIKSVLNLDAKKSRLRQNHLPRTGLTKAELQEAFSSGDLRDAKYVCQCIENFDYGLALDFRLELPLEWSTKESNRLKAWLPSIGFEELASMSGSAFYSKNTVSYRILFILE